VLLALALGGCSGAPKGPTDVVVRDPFAFEAKVGATGALYAVVVNGTDSAETLDSITSTVGFVSMHDQVPSNGMVTMVPIDRPVIAAHDSLVFEPGARHLMLEGQLRDLVAGDSVDLAFWFTRRGDVRVIAVVRPYGS
jgi:copper(I)-binding protein